MKRKTIPSRASGRTAAKRGKPSASPSAAPDESPAPAQTSDSDGTAADAFVALLRGVNVAGAKPVRMPALAALFRDEGFTSPATYIQSGNVVFARPAAHRVPAAPRSLASHIAAAVERDFGFTVPVLVLARDHLRAAVAENPFLGIAGVAEKQLHVTFLADPLDSRTVPKLDASAQLDAEKSNIDLERDMYCVAESRQAVFIFTPNGYGRTKLNNNAIERASGIPATTRNWATCLQLLNMVDKI
ncbi:hypothetical protein HDU82_004419 [Entophlyctis luteolus]|nr:hypothetical protein HDU82_004419 [Entophlyctis luteolus]